MDILEDPMFKNKYQKCKLRVKLWESDFMEKYGRKPNKNDIKEADTIIREAYKMYWKLKTRALEETLMDITFSDDIQANISANPLSTSTLEDTQEQHEVTETDTKNSENVKPSPTKDKKETDYEAVQTSESVNVKGAWGNHLSKEKEVMPEKKKNIFIGRSSSFQLSQKMFKSTSLTKRNPRKSLSMTKLKSKSDLDTATDANTLAEKAASPREDGFEIDDVLKPMFGENFKVVQVENKVISNSVSAVQQLIEGRVPTVDRKLNSGWLERCSKQNNLEPLSYDPQRLSGTSDSGVESMESSIYSPNHVVPPLSQEKSLPLSDEEDFVYNSDSEEDRKNKRVRNLRKESSDWETQVAKRPCIEVDDGVFTDMRTIGDVSSCDITTKVASNSVSDVKNVVVNKDESNDDETRAKPIDLELSSSAYVNCNVGVVEKDSQIDASKDDGNDGNKNEKSVVQEFPASPDTSFANENIKESTKASKVKPAVSRRVRRVIKHDSTDDFEPEDDEEEEYKPKKTRATSRKTKKNLNSEETKKPTKTRKPQTNPSTRKLPVKGRRKKAEVLDKEMDSEDTQSQRTNTTSTSRKQPARGSSRKEEVVEKTVNPEIIYGVETLEAVPRFVLPKAGTGDLVTDFALAVTTSDSQSGDVTVAAKPRTKLTDKEKLEQKVAAGKINENFVRINLKKKVFVRGKKTMNFQKYKKNQWKQRKKELASGEGGLDLADLAEKNGVMTCFKCGDVGHFSRQCKAMKSAELLPLDGDEEQSVYPTLEEAEKMASQTALSAHATRIDRLPRTASKTHALEPLSSKLPEPEEYDDIVDDVDFSEAMDGEVPVQPTFSGHKIPEDLLATLLRPETGPVQPLYPTGPDNSLTDTPSEVFEALRMFGHQNFRPGQEKAVMRILSGQSTLVTLSTGSGKTLCYQLPAYLYAKHSPCITLVVSPLVSLMDDQVTGVPSFLSAACLHTNQTPKQRETVMDMVKQAKLDILLVSPEAVVAGEKSTGFGALLRQLPPIAFACIDEAHCISQWSHNFRPSYLMICRVLREKLGVRTVLGLTATATKGTAESIVNHLQIHDGLAGIISDTPMPSNLTLTVSKDEIRDRALVALLESERFKDCDSVIVYCTRRDECVRLAGLLRTMLQDPKNHEKPNQKVSGIAEAYHAGLHASRRKVVQKAFMSGQIRIVVATVAFGMGINKPDIRAVIHHNMPSSFEGYVQEVGRAGRDGLPAQCHLFLDSREGGDKSELRRHIHANGVDRHMVRRLLQKVFLPCSCTKVGTGRGERCPGHEVAIPVEETVRALDIPEEMISTLLCYLELHPKRFITVLSSVYVTAKVTSYNGPKALKAAAQSSPPLAMAIALDLKRGISHDDSSIVEFPIVDVAAAIGWDSGVAKSHLKKLEWKSTDSGISQRTAISVRFETLGFRVKAPGDLTDAELDEALDALASRASSQEISRTHQLEAIHTALSQICVPSVRQCMYLNEETMNKSDMLKKTIRSYFQSDDPLANFDLKAENKLANEAQIAADVRALVCSYRDNSFTGRAVARIFHGIQSPNYPALVWSRCRFWRAHLAANFNLICQVATKEILAMR